MGLDRPRGRGRLEDAHRIGRRRRKDLFPRQSASVARPANAPAVPRASRERRSRRRDVLAGTTPPPRARRRVTAGRRAKPSSRVQQNELSTASFGPRAHGARDKEGCPSASIEPARPPDALGSAAAALQ